MDAVDLDISEDGNVDIQDKVETGVNIPFHVHVVDHAAEDIKTINKEKVYKNLSVVLSDKDSGEVLYRWKFDDSLSDDINEEIVFDPLLVPVKSEKTMRITFTVTPKTIRSGNTAEGHDVSYKATMSDLYDADNVFSKEIVVRSSEKPVAVVEGHMNDGFKIDYKVHFSSYEEYEEASEDGDVFKFTWDGSESKGGGNKKVERYIWRRTTEEKVLGTDKHFTAVYSATDFALYPIALTVANEFMEWDTVTGYLNVIPWDDSTGEPIKKPKAEDPNEMSGPIGLGNPETERFVKPGEWMTYTIYFENVSNATAAAQEVYVTNPLSEWLDWSTFEMGEVAFGNQIDLGLTGKKFGNCEATMRGTNFIVRTTFGGGFDGGSTVAKQGVANWYMRIVDPTTKTGWPKDILAGFLPPNDNTFRGEGHLTYRIKVRDDAPAGVIITNKASIVFDYNEPIETDPAWWNTVGQVKDIQFVDGTGGSATQNLIVGAPYGEKLTVAPTYEKPGYTFAGWFTGPNGTGRHITAESLVEEGDNGLYADWTANTYFIAYNANGGEGEMAIQTNTYDVVSCLASNAFTFAQHRFAGWATNETGEVLYEDGATVSNLTDVAGDTVELFAVWRQVADVTVEIDGVTTKLTFIVGEPFGELPEPGARDDATFGGWFTGPDGTGQRVTATSIVPAGLTGLYAYWIANAPVYALHDSPVYGGLSSAYKGGTFNGYAVDGDGLISGTFVLAVKKPAKGKTTSAATLTFVSLATGKKTKVTGTVNLATGVGSGGLAGLKIGANAVGGTVAKVGALEGGADAAKSKNAAALSVLSKFSGKSYVIALEPENPAALAQGGYSTLAITMAAKGKAKVSGVLADGTKVTASGMMTVGDTYCCVPVIYSKKSKFGFVAWFDKNTRQLVDVTALTPWRNTVKPAFTMAWDVQGIGAKGNVAAGARTVGLDEAKLSGFVPGAIAQTPFDIPLKVSGTKWDAGKAAKVAYKGGAVSITGTNVSGLKLTYTAKTGLFKGSFTVYAVKGGKLVKNKFSVFGAVTGGVGFGTAVLKGKGSVSLLVH